MKKYLLNQSLSFRKKNEKSFYSSLFLSFFISSVISTLLLTLFLTVNFFNSISSSTKHFNRQLLAQSNYAIEQMQENVELLTASLLSNETITAFLSLTSMENTNIPVLASRDVNNQLTTLPYLDSIYLYNAKLDILYASNSGYQQNPSSFENQPVISRIYDQDFIDTYQGQPVPSDDIFTYYIFDAYSPNPGKKSAIIINVKASTLTDSIVSMTRFTDEKKSNFLLLDSDMSYLLSILNDDISSADTWVNSALDSLSREKNLISTFVEVDGTTYFQTHTAQNIYGWNLFNLTPAKLLFQNILTTIVAGFLIWMGVLIFVLFICQYFARKLNKPVEQLSQYLEELHFNKEKEETFKTREFKKILSTISSLQKNNQQLRAAQQKTRYALTQSFLNNLIVRHLKDAPELITQQLAQLNLDYLEKEKLCMTVFKIDDYHRFLTEHNEDELWTIQFAVVNIIEELASADFTCNAFYCDHDKFVLLLSCTSEEDLIAFEDKLVLLLQNIQNTIEAHLHFTLTAAYSNIFHGMDKLSVTYENIKHSLLLKIRYGHNAVIDPYRIDDVKTEPFHLSSKSTFLLFDRLANGQFKEAWSAYETLTNDLFCYDYDEIMATMIHLLYSSYGHFLEKYPMLKDVTTNALKVFMAQLEYVEIQEDIQNLSRAFFETLCSSVQKLKETLAEESLAALTENVEKIINEQYSDPSLCLATIAEQVGFSPNYVGQVFKQYVQKSVAQYLLDVRMEKIAYYLKTTSLPLNKILDKVGLELNNYFYTRFKKYFGMSLSEYRQKFGNESE